jgi:hypothetical protein
MAKIWVAPRTIEALVPCVVSTRNTITHYMWLDQSKNKDEHKRTWSTATMAKGWTTHLFAFLRSRYTLPNWLTKMITHTLTHPLLIHGAKWHHIFTKHTLNIWIQFTENTTFRNCRRYGRNHHSRFHVQVSNQNFPALTPLPCSEFCAPTCQ